MELVVVLKSSTVFANAWTCTASVVRVALLVCPAETLVTVPFRAEYELESAWVSLGKSLLADETTALVSFSIWLKLWTIEFEPVESGSMFLIFLTELWRSLTFEQYEGLPHPVSGAANTAITKPPSTHDRNGYWDCIAEVNAIITGA